MTEESKPETEPQPLVPAERRAELIERQAYVADWWNPKTFEQAMEMAEMMSKTSVIPSDFRNKPGDIMVAWSLGAPMGMSLLSCLRHIAVINGLPQIWGDAALAITRAHPRCEWVREWIEGEGDEMEAICHVKRRGDSKVVEGKFSVSDAKTAGLWGRESKKGEPMPWKQYPKRMLQMRARSFAIRDAFPDALCGMPIVEEMRDITDQVTVKDAEPEGDTATEKLKNILKEKRATVVDEAEGVTAEDVENVPVEPPAQKTIEDYIAEAKTTEDTARLMQEITNRMEDGKITKKRWGELTELVQKRSQEIAAGRKKK